MIKLKNTKRKILTVSFFAALMLMVPLSGATNGKIVEHLESQGGQSFDLDVQEEQSLEYILLDGDPPVLDMLNVIIFYQLEQTLLELVNLYELNDYNVENNQMVFLTEEEVETVVMNVMNEQSVPLDGETTGTTDIGSTGIEDDVDYSDEAIRVENDNIDLEGSIYLQVGTLETFESAIIQLTKDTVLENLTIDEIMARLGWVGQLASNVYNVQTSYAQFRYNLTPNVTLVEMLEATVEAFTGQEFNFYEYLNDTTKNNIIDLIVNRQFLFSGLGIRQAIWENFIVPNAEIIAQGIIDSIYNKLNIKPSEISVNIWTVFKDKLTDFILFIIGKNNDNGDDDGNKWKRISRIKKFVQTLKAVLNGGLIIASFVYAYLDGDKWEEYEQGIQNSLTELLNSVDNLYVWVVSEPWTKPISINGSIIGYDPQKQGGLRVYTEQKPDDYVLTDSEGYFEGLVYYTTMDDVTPPFWVHECVTTAVNDSSGETGTVDGLLETGAFSNGLLYVNINMSAEDDDYAYMQPHSNEVAQEQETTTQESTELLIKQS